MAGKMTRLEKQWILYDVGNSAFTMLCTTIIPIYFKNIATVDNLSNSDSTAFLSFTLSLSTIQWRSWDRSSERWRTQKIIRSRCLSAPSWWE